MTQAPSLHILIVEDQLSIARNIAEFLEHKGHVMDFAEKGPQGLALALNNYYDLVILDLNLPGMDGVEVCKHIREKADRHVPVLMLTARDSIADKVSGFHSGADDYLTKPFSLEELEVRCLALSRRHRLNTHDVIELGPLCIDRKRKTLSRDGQPVALNSMGFRILMVLVDAYPQVVSRSELSHKLWGDEPTESDALRSHIYQLRNLMDKPFARPVIKTVFGVGFTLDIEQSE
ncbi:response regulator transcription factor [Planctobacterium marinum]|uniref:response regulator transcription factor n=1 Tax=Planctobacterium marinum TaxID=1631968 RepID=UPI001E50E993|nr:response regulator transcription factor [Planctobacterium marinum]MCC2605680.1 response regulator transcription factor [Planctobacterium marinum]